MALVADSGGIFALYDARDRHHAAVSSLLRETATTIYLPSPLLGELGYMLSQWLGTKALLRFLSDVEAGAFRIEPFLMDDLRRTRALLKTYSELDLGLCDAAVVATAERLGLDRILTVDERDFRVIRSSKGSPFKLLPADYARKI